MRTMLLNLSMRYIISIVLFLFCSQVPAINYEQNIQHIQQSREKLRQAYIAGKNRQKILLQAGRLFERAVTQLTPYWHGTRWSFNGTSDTPGRGSIACGYFVTTVLQHSGLKLNRYKLAQMASENMILQLTKKVKRYRQVKFSRFLSSIKKWGKGLYVVGLDNHTGFIHYDGQQIYFIHSAFAWPFSVQKESARRSHILRDSEYRVLGRLDWDKALIRKWLLAQPI